MSSLTALAGKKSEINLLQILGGSLFLALCAQISIKLPFSPVPITAQTFGVLLIGCLLGSRQGFLCVAAYLAQIAFGLPFLAGGVIKPWAILGTNGGYLAGMAVQAYVAGWFMENGMGKKATRAFVGCSVACIIQLTMGYLWLTNFVGWTAALYMGVYPFIAGELLKVVAVSYYVQQRK